MYLVNNQSDQITDSNYGASSNVKSKIEVTFTRNFGNHNNTISKL